MITVLQTMAQGMRVEDLLRYDSTRGLSVSKNGDVYIADYTARLIERISAATGLMSYVAGALTGTPGERTLQQEVTRVMVDRRRQRK